MANPTTFRWNSTSKQRELFNEWKKFCVGYLVSCKEGVRVRRIRDDLREHTGEDIPLDKMGFPTINHFLYQMADSLEVRRIAIPVGMSVRPELLVFIKEYAIPSEMQHIRKFVLQQQKAKTKSNRVKLTRNQSTSVAAISLLQHAPRFTRSTSVPAPSARPVVNRPVTRQQPARTYSPPTRVLRNPPPPTQTSRNIPSLLATNTRSSAPYVPPRSAAASTSTRNIVPPATPQNVTVPRNVQPVAPLKPICLPANIKADAGSSSDDDFMDFDSYSDEDVVDYSISKNLRKMQISTASSGSTKQQVRAATINTPQATIVKPKENLPSTNSLKVSTVRASTTKPDGNKPEVGAPKTSMTNKIQPNENKIKDDQRKSSMDTHLPGTSSDPSKSSAGARTVNITEDSLQVKVQVSPAPAPAVENGKVPSNLTFLPPPMKFFSKFAPGTPKKPEPPKTLFKPLTNGTTKEETNVPKTIDSSPKTQTELSTSAKPQPVSQASTEVTPQIKKSLAACNNLTEGKERKSVVPPNGHCVDDNLNSKHPLDTLHYGKIKMADKTPAIFPTVLPGAFSKSNVTLKTYLQKYEVVVNERLALTLFSLEDHRIYTFA